MTNPPTPPYTEATVELVAQTLWAEAWRPAGRPRQPTPTCYDDARAALNALVKAGLLLPEGAETRTEYVVQIRREDGSARAVDSIPLPTEDLAHEVAAEPFSSPGVRADVVRRRVFDAVIASYVDAVRLAEGDSSNGAAEGGGEADQSKDPR